MLSESFKGYMRQQQDLKAYKGYKPPKDLIEGVLPSGSITLLTGHPKTGKSFIAQSWAYAVATGLPWNGLEAEQGGVLYLYPDGEHLGRIYPRFEALEKFNGQEYDSDYLVFREQFSIQSEADRANVLEGLTYDGLKLVVIDTLAAAAGGLDLNAQRDVATIGEFVKSITQGSNGKVSVLIVLHSTKSDSQGVSGSIQLKALASVVYAMTVKRDAANGNRYAIECTDSRDSDSSYQDHLRLKELELESGQRGVVLVSTDPPTTKLSAISADLRVYFPELSPGVWQQQSYLVKAVMEKLEKSDSAARRWLDEAVKLGALVTTGLGIYKQYSVPTPQSPQRDTTGDTHTVPTITHSLKSGDRGDAGELF